MGFGFGNWDFIGESRDGGKTKADSSKGKAVDLAVTQIERQYGKGAIMKLGAEAMLGEMPTVSTGSLSLILLWVWEDCQGEGWWRSTALNLRKDDTGPPCGCGGQKKGGIAAFIDAEHALDVHYAKRLGVKIDELLIST